MWCCNTVQSIGVQRSDELASWIMARLVILVDDAGRGYYDDIVSAEHVFAYDDVKLETKASMTLISSVIGVYLLSVSE